MKLFDQGFLFAPSHALLLLVWWPWAISAQVLDSLDQASITASAEKVKVELVDGHDGKAVRVSFAEECRNAYAFTKVRGTADWDSAVGFSFWVKGDGSDHLGGLEFIWNEDYGVRYAFAFPIRNTAWQKIHVLWKDLLPETSSTNARPLGLNGNAPSKLGPMWLGKWWYWRDFGAHSYTIDDIRLERALPPGSPAPIPSSGLSRVTAKLKAGKPITIVTMGDSLTDAQHWANREVNWPALLKNHLEQTYKSSVTLINPAIGGTELRQNMVLMPRWLQQSPEPDLVTLCFGGNDWNSGMRGEAFAQSMETAVGRIRELTGGKAEVLVMTTLPSVGAWDTLSPLAEAGRRAGESTQAGIADTYAAFHKVGATNRELLYVDDKVHLSKAGHEVMVRTVAEVFEKILRKDP